jgi:cell wall-associated NlpC family hydrolase
VTSSSSSRRLVVAAAAVLAVLSAACASTGYAPRPFPVPGGAPAGPTAAPAPAPAGKEPFDGYALVGTALALRGAPYRNGGTDPKGFDCSGFTQYVFEQHGIALPREVREQYRVGKAINADDLAPGDLLFFATTDTSASHVAIAVGGDEFVHAPSSTGVVRVERLSAGYWAQRYLGARRVK